MTARDSFSFAEAANAEPLRAYFVQLIRAGVVERQFEALAVDSLACATDAAGQANGAKVKVMSLDAWRQQCRDEEAVRREISSNVRYAQELGMLA